MTLEQKKQYDYLLDFYSKAPKNIPSLPRDILTQINVATSPNVIQKMIREIHSRRITHIAKAYYSKTDQAWYFMHI